MFLVDTSIWIEVFRRPARFHLTSHIDLDEAVTCLPVVQEVLQGFRDEPAYRLARDAMLSFPIVESPISRDVFLEAVSLYRGARRSGISIRSGVDCLIAACAIRHDLTILHRDRDFAGLSRVSSLISRAI